MPLDGVVWHARGSGCGSSSSTGHAAKSEVVVEASDVVVEGSVATEELAYEYVEV